MIGIVAPVDIAKRCEILGISSDEFMANLNKMIAALAGKEIVIVPDKNSASAYIASKHNGKVVGVVPQDDTEFGIGNLDLSVCNEIVNCGSWRNQPETMLTVCDVLVVLGLGCGEMIELCYTKWFKVKKVFMIDEFLSMKLPKDIEDVVKPEYLSVDELMLG